MKKYLLIIASFLLLLSSCSETPKEKAEKAVKDYVTAIQKGDIKCADWENLSPEYVITNIDSLVIDSTKISGINSFYVYAHVEDKLVKFDVEQDPESSDFKVLETRGLYAIDLAKIKEKTGCMLQRPYYENDFDAAKEISQQLYVLQKFEEFSNTISSNDTSMIYQLYPQFKNYNYSISTKPTAKSIRVDSGRYRISCSDSTSYEFSMNGNLTDCLGVISVEDAENEVKRFGVDPKPRGSNFDIAYILGLKEQAKALAEEQARKLAEIEKEKARKEKANKYIKQGVALISSQFSNNGKGAKGVKFKALNTSNKTAKYIIMEVVGYNSVDDPVYSDGYLKRCRGIGPIGPGEAGSWDFDEIWERGDLVESYEIKALVIQFKDGTSKRVKLPRPIPSNYRDWLY
ncbi:MAG: hypothetical protein K2M55_01220 [Muribaculaceae bacterium]|nr:hypothetical protein [Muribaculaceae bacterium]